MAGPAHAATAARRAAAVAPVITSAGPSVVSGPGQTITIGGRGFSPAAVTDIVRASRAADGSRHDGVGDAAASGRPARHRRRGERHHAGRDRPRAERQDQGAAHPHPAGTGP